MKSRLFTSSIFAMSVGLLLSTSAFADRGYRHHHYDDDDYAYATYEDDYGRVLDTRPIYQRVAIDVPHESCGVQTVVHEERRRNGDSFAGTVMGGLVGAAIGHELGNGRGAATAAGGLIGASIGNDASRDSHVVSYRDQEVCHTRYYTEYEERLVGYDVSYSYHGRIYQTRTNRHPGDRIAIAVAVHPRDD